MCLFSKILYIFFTSFISAINSIYEYVMASVNELTIRVITHGVREGVEIEDIVQVFSLVSLEPFSFFRIGFIKYKK